MSKQPIPQEEWRTCIENLPLVSVDLVVRSAKGILLGKRTNQPAKGEWFVPGGTVLKHERLTDAVHRVADEEAGLTVTIDRQLGVYEHFYDVAELDDIDGKHYVAVGYLVTAQGEELRLDSQHEDLRWFAPPFENRELHPYVRAYLTDAGLSSEDE